MFEFLKGKKQQEASKLVINDQITSSNYIAVTFDESHACEGITDIQYFIASNPVNINRAVIVLMSRLFQMMDNGEATEKEIQEIISESQKCWANQRKN